MRSRLLFLLMPLLLSGSLAHAQTPAPAPAKPKPAAIPNYTDLKFPPLRQVRIPEVEQFKLPNGMRVYLLENHELPLISGFALVRTGNLFEPKDKIGLAGITGTVMRTGGTAAHTGDELDEQLENMAASVEASIGETSGSVSFSGMSSNTAEILAVFKDVLTNPAFRQERLDLAKSQMRSAISRRNDNASAIASREFSDLVYGKDNPYGWRMEYEHLANIERQDLVDFYRRYFFPSNIMLAVYGDFKAPEMRSQLEKLFADWTHTQPPVPPFPEVTPPQNQGVFLAVKEDVNQTFFQMGHLGGILRDPDYPALQVAADILGGGFSSRLFRRVRTQLGYAYGVGAGWGANYNHPGIFSISGSTRAEATTETLKVVQEELARVRTAEVTEQELKTAKDTVLNSFVFAFDTPYKTLSRMVRYEYFGYPADFIYQYQKAIEAVSRADVLRVAKRYFEPERFTIVTVGKPDLFGEPLTALGPVKEIDLTIPPPPGTGTSTGGEASAPRSEQSAAAGLAALRQLQQAVGGVEKLAAVRDFEQVSTGTLRTPQGPMNVRQVTRWAAPNHWRQEQNLPFGKVEVYFDGSSGWLMSPQGLMDMPPPMRQQASSEMFRTWVPLLLSDRDSQRSLHLAGPGALEITTPGGEWVRLEFDPATGLPQRRIYRSIAMQGEPRMVTETILDWREEAGVKFPASVKIEQDGQDYAEAKLESIKVNAGLTPEELGKKP